MFFAVFKFELAYWFRRPLTLLFFAVFFLMAFFSTASDSFLNVGGTGQIHRNAPFILALAVAILTAIGQVITTAIAGTAVLRDEQIGSQELLFTTRMTKSGYLLGRFLGSFLVMLVIYVGLPLGLLIGMMMPWIDADKLGPIRMWAAFQPFFTIAVPNLFFVSALLFAIGALTRKLFAVYVTGIGVLLVWQITQQITGDLDKLTLASAIDPFAFTSITVITRYWSVAEKNAQLVPLHGALLANRLIWIAISLLLFGAVAAFFRLRLQQPRVSRKIREATRATPGAAPLNAVPIVTQVYRRSAWLRAVWSQARFQLRFVLREAPFLAITAIAVINIMISAWYQSHPGDSIRWPVTASLIPSLRDAMMLFIVLIATLYGGELTWRDRQLRGDQLQDALPAPSWVSFAGKLLAILGATIVLELAAIAGLMVMQLVQGYTHLQPLLYLEGLVFGVLPTMVAIAAIALGIHAIVNQKFVGHLFVIAYYIITLVLVRLGFNYRLWQVGAPLGFTYSDMNGWGPFLPRIFVLGTYSVAWALAIATLGYLVLPRGTVSGWGDRLTLARRRWRSGGFALVSLCAAIAIGAGGLFYYNANVLNQYVPVRQAEAVQKAIELEYRPLMNLAQPRIVAVSLRHEFYPARRAATWNGTMRTVNHDSRPVDTLFVDVPLSIPTPTDPYNTTSNDGMGLDSLTFDRPVTLIRDDTPRGIRLYRLATPMQPGDSLVMHFAGHFTPHGFPNGAFDQDVAANGSFMSSQYYPGFGYNEQNELADDDIRTRNGLKPRPRMKSIDDPTVRDNNYLRHDADFVAFDETACTSVDQIALAPGYLQSDSTINGRRCLHYVMDKPILDFSTTLSGRYVVDSVMHNGVMISVYHIPAHAFAVPSMIQAAKDGLDYFGTHFSPYQFRQYRVIEYPQYQTFAEAFANTIPFSEAIGFIYRNEPGDDKIDLAYFVTAHELAHQWWAHQVVGGDGQGATMFSEGLAEYSALTIMEKRDGPEVAQKFLRRELDGYLQGRSVEKKKEVPLLLVENQPYIHYRKGSLVFYALRDYIGEDAMNSALRAFLGKWAFKGPPYPTARDLYSEFEQVTPDSLKYVLKDLFLDMTFYDNKVDTATATRRPDGQYAVHLVLDAKKLKGDSLGNMAEVPIGDYVDVGVFGAHVNGQKLGKRLLVEKVHITQPVTVLDVVVPALPIKAGIDPYNILIDRTPEDNVTTVTIVTAPSTHH
ncbi:MAG TPA: M1 family aminopeptidase [Gemmatimonadales bacterium]|jgi:hypothetical protein